MSGSTVKGTMQKRIAERKLIFSYQGTAAQYLDLKLKKYKL